MQPLFTTCANLPARRLVPFSKRCTRAYSVRFSNDRMDLECKDLDEFSQYILSRNNHGNHARVLCGRVRLSHALLSNGVSLVDTPGLEGVYDNINELGRDFLSEQQGLVVCVTLARDFGHLMRAWK